MRVLLAEDDELLGSGLRAGLRQHGFAVDWVRDGVAAERELLTGQHAVAVLDLGLPRQDGMDALAAVRETFAQHGFDNATVIGELTAAGPARLCVR